jgi:hypothetical protein
MVQDAEEKRSHARPAFKPIETCEERQKDVLDDVLGLGWPEAHTARGAIQPPRVVIDHRRERCGIAPLQTLDKFGIANHVLHVTPWLAA